MTVPPRELAPASEWKGLHRVTTRSDSYTTKEFAVTDSTIVITRLGGSDKQYGDVDLPITISLGDVQSVERLEIRPEATFVALAAGAALIFLIIGLMNFEIDMGN